ncbi:ABC transporter permease [Paenibacillus cisolokensis]|uniref:ABC transporter permease n=1 Tax=Paenibacillus TaxID=44249 RepID=UPI000721E2C9|nr:ABC transporter permease [Paenibacillus sp. 32O-W]ALS26446.1 sugar ABC transporter permease [Paenibacillus sp. 32O-W]
MVEARKNISYIRLIRSYGTLIAGVLIVLAFSILSPDSFATIDNAINISRQISFLVIIALGATLVMAVGEFDLSVGAMASLGGVFAAKLAVAGYPLAVVILLPMLVALAIGYANGWIVTRFRVLSFITTLAMGTIIGGINFRITGGATVFENIPDSFRYLGQTEWGNVPLLSIIMLLMTVLFWYIMSHTAFGRKLYAIGGNESASRVAGVRVALNKNAAFALCSMLATLTGILMASRLGSAHPNGGDGLFLSAYAAAFLGMTSFKEGVPNVWGTFVGAAIIGILANGMTILNVPTFMQDVITGCIVIAAVLIQKLGRDRA